MQYNRIIDWNKRRSYYYEQLPGVIPALYAYVVFKQIEDDNIGDLLCRHKRSDPWLILEPTTCEWVHWGCGRPSIDFWVLLCLSHGDI